MLALLSLALLAAVPADSTESATALVRKTVTHYIAPFDATPEAGLWRIAWADLNHDGLEDALVLAGDPDWCNARGCTLLIVEAVPEEDQEEWGLYTVAAEVRAVNAPIQLGKTHTGRWTDLLVQSEDGATWRLQFNGETYPFSPTDGTAADGEAGALMFAADE
jgi:hypothetical protein